MGNVAASSNKSVEDQVPGVHSSHISNPKLIRKRRKENCACPLALHDAYRAFLIFHRVFFKHTWPPLL